ncbi:hypothetical protein [Arthrobacter bambusae]|uniref:DUF2384 domain-containing protein n=1 Tax=Arthrobacter bambusae TaxID=1338426 RepID=A0AAW8DEQ8_9MICC|nr:hypothetical protein [Arthrobacter bambusae]MDP9903153.1 hypothetical protein [Arthrobacter bambusae]MDQ0128853.1 hypothetical protein [Arthrobacter bambusae]MDQ0180194.1 hypothetical protein [Arthrobacter bambusae]
MMPAAMYRSPVPEQLWERIRDEFGLPALEQVRERLSPIYEDPEPVMRQLVRIFLDEGTYCPGFQFCTDLSLNQLVVELFHRAVELRIPHNYFTLWMMLPCPALEGARPVDLHESGNAAGLLEALERTLADAAA